MRMSRRRHFYLQVNCIRGHPKIHHILSKIEEFFRKEVGGGRVVVSNTSIFLWKIDDKLRRKEVVKRNATHRRKLMEIMKKGDFFNSKRNFQRV